MGPAVRFSGITRRFPGVVALHDVSFDVEAGTCHAVCGENGAGKSTLGRVLAGIDRPDEGTITVDGQRARFANPSEALAAGVAMVHQELAFCENLSVAENLCLGNLPSTAVFVSRGAMRDRAREMLEAFGSGIDVTRPMASLSVAEQQLVQVSVAVGSGARILVFDEPTSSLSENEARRLHALTRVLTARGKTVLYVSHRMHEIFALTSSVTVLRDGRHVATGPTAALDEPALVRLMIGRDVATRPAATVAPTNPAELLRVDRLTAPGHFRQVSFTLHAGEVLGVAGLVGAGRSELARAIFGLESGVSGTVSVGGRAVDMRSPRDAIALGLGLVPEDRKHQGLVLSLLARENISLPFLTRFSRRGIVRRIAERRVVHEYSDSLRLSRAKLEVEARQLSGGNQQKLMFARWLAAGSRVLLLDEPTRGVDVAAKAELHHWIRRLAAEGHGVLLISSELPELLALSSRVLVLRSGRLVGEVDAASTTQGELLRLMAGLEAVLSEA